MKLIGACVRHGRNAYRFWWGNLEEMDHLEDLGVDEIMFKKVFKKYGRSDLRLNSFGSKKGQVAGCFEYYHEYFSSIKCREYDQFNNCCILRTKRATRS